MGRIQSSYSYSEQMLGSIIAVVVLEDLEPGEEVFSNYGDDVVYSD